MDTFIKVRVGSFYEYKLLEIFPMIRKRMTNVIPHEYRIEFALFTYYLAFYFRKRNQSDY